MVSQIKKAKLKIVVSNHLQKWSQKLKRPSEADVSVRPYNELPRFLIICCHVTNHLATQSVHW